MNSQLLAYTELKKFLGFTIAMLLLLTPLRALCMGMDWVSYYEYNTYTEITYDGCLELSGMRGLSQLSVPVDRSFPYAMGEYCHELGIWTVFDTSAHLRAEDPILFTGPKEEALDYWIDTVGVDIPTIVNRSGVHRTFQPTLQNVLTTVLLLEFFTLIFWVPLLLALSIFVILLVRHFSKRVQRWNTIIYFLLSVPLVFITLYVACTGILIFGMYYFRW